MNDYSQMSMLEVAVEILKHNEGKMKMTDLLAATLKAKELEDTNNELATRLYLDITTSALFVYMGDEEWELKANRPIKEYDRDGSEFNSKEDLLEDEEENTQTFTDVNYDNEIDEFDEDDDDDYEEDEDNFDDEEDEDSFDDEEDTPKYHNNDDDEYEDEDGNILKRYSEDDDDFDEDKYNDYMDDFEDMYDDR